MTAMSLLEILGDLQEIIALLTYNQCFLFEKAMHKGVLNKSYI